MLFLDPELLSHFEYPSANVSIPPHIRVILGNINDVYLTSNKYFANIHPWMPIISKQRFYDVHLLLSPLGKPDIGLLFLAQKLITTHPPASPQAARTELYHAAKHFCLELEGSNIFSLPILQANILIALYEIGHAVYPAAYLTVGACARYAHALGLNVKGVRSRKGKTMIEAEERRRVWWAIVILDR